MDNGDATMFTMLMMAVTSLLLLAWINIRLWRRHVELAQKRAQLECEVQDLKDKLYKAGDSMATLMEHSRKLHDLFALSQTELFKASQAYARYVADWQTGITTSSKRVLFGALLSCDPETDERLVDEVASNVQTMLDEKFLEFFTQKDPRVADQTLAMAVGMKVVVRRTEVIDDLPWEPGLVMAKDDK
jgi:hypothetical protein